MKFKLLLSIVFSITIINCFGERPKLVSASNEQECKQKCPQCSWIDYPMPLWGWGPNTCSYYPN